MFEIFEVRWFKFCWHGMNMETMLQVLVDFDHLKLVKSVVWVNKGLIPVLELVL